MRKTRKSLFALGAAVLLVAVAFAVPAGLALAGTDGSPVATQSKKKCKKGKKNKKKKCKKRKGAGVAYAEGRYLGTYAETGGTTYFTVHGSELYTEGWDIFSVDAGCSDGSTNSQGGPVHAPIGNGSFAASGSWPHLGHGALGGGDIPWRISGQIAGRTVSNGVFSIGPYNDFAPPQFGGNACGGTVHFTAQWCLVPSSCVSPPFVPSSSSGMDGPRASATRSMR
jgi:hypothetical protein